MSIGLITYCSNLHQALVPLRPHMVQNEANPVFVEEECVLVRQHSNREVKNCFLWWSLTRPTAVSNNALQWNYCSLLSPLKRLERLKNSQHGLNLAWIPERDLPTIPPKFLETDFSIYCSETFITQLSGISKEIVWNKLRII